jgi:hypothetical protein
MSSDTSGGQTVEIAISLIDPRNRDFECKHHVVASYQVNCFPLLPWVKERFRECAACPQPTRAQMAS